MDDARRTAVRQWLHKAERDLVLLVDECTGLDGTLAGLAEAAEVLTPYGTAFRYPGDVKEPQLSDAWEAVDCARRVLDGVALALHAESTGSGRLDSDSPGA